MNTLKTILLFPFVAFITVGHAFFAVAVIALGLLGLLVRGTVSIAVELLGDAWDLLTLVGGLAWVAVVFCWQSAAARVSRGGR